MKSSLVSSFLEGNSNLSHSIVFFYFFALITEEAFLSLLAILWNSAFRWVYLSFSPLLFTSLVFTAICKASSDSHFAFLHFFFLRMVLIPVSCTMSRHPFIVLQALYQIWYDLSDIICHLSVDISSKSVFREAVFNSCGLCCVGNLQELDYFLISS